MEISWRLLGLYREQTMTKALKPVRKSSLRMESEGGVKPSPLWVTGFATTTRTEISPELEKLHNLLKEHQRDHFFNEDVRLKAKKLPRGFRPRTEVDREFARNLAAHWKKVRRQRPGR